MRDLKTCTRSHDSVLAPGVPHETWSPLLGRPRAYATTMPSRPLSADTSAVVKLFTRLDVEAIDLAKHRTEMPMGFQNRAPGLSCSFMRLAGIRSGGRRGWCGG